MAKSNLFTALTALLFSHLISYIVHASVHDYRGQVFTPTGNAFILHGGSEGLYASSDSDHDSNFTGSNGDSYIR
jgi:hypothetical protein